jgi:hypothetical protein
MQKSRAITNHKEDIPYSHYRDIYCVLDPRETSARCALPFVEGAFSLTLMGQNYRAAHPDFALEEMAGTTPPVKAVEKTLILRYLCEGRYTPETGKRLSYNEVPWGPVYYHNFEGRCLKRLAGSFGGDIPRFKRIIESTPALKAEKLPQGDAGYRLEFLNGLFISLILYAPDDEFPASAQILFDDNLIFAFSAEDLAVAGEVLIDRLKALDQGPSYIL